MSRSSRDNFVQFPNPALDIAEIQAEIHAALNRTYISAIFLFISVSASAIYALSQGG